MKILIAPDSFKGTLSADEVCDIIGNAFEDTIKDISIVKLPVADGGEGLCACLFSICGGEMISAKVKGVFGEDMTAEYLMLPDKTAVVEMAACSGLPLAGDNKNPEKTSTYGVGQLILDAVSNNAEKIMLGLGGSATNDCGIGMASALGYKFVDKNGNELNPIGMNLGKISTILSPDKKIDIPVVAACDVENPLFGSTGAAYVFAPQKGADEEMVKRLDDGLRNIASVIKETLGRDVSSLKGAGAAGGLGAGAVVFLDAKLQKGIDIILDTVGFDKAAADADLIITGEGRLDFQSVDGKVISGIALRAKEMNKKVITICGCEGPGAEKAKDVGVAEMYYSCTEPKPFDEVKKTCREDLYKAAVTAAKNNK